MEKGSIVVDSYSSFADNKNNLNTNDLINKISTAILENKNDKNIPPVDANSLIIGQGKKIYIFRKIWIEKLHILTFLWI